MRSTRTLSSSNDHKLAEHLHNIEASTINQMPDGTALDCAGKCTKYMMSTMHSALDGTSSIFLRDFGAMCRRELPKRGCQRSRAASCSNYDQTKQCLARTRHCKTFPLYTSLVSGVQYMCDRQRYGLCRCRVSSRAQIAAICSHRVQFAVCTRRVREHATMQVSRGRRHVGKMRPLSACDRQCGTGSIAAGITMKQLLQSDLKLLRVLDQHMTRLTTSEACRISKCLLKCVRTKINIVCDGSVGSILAVSPMAAHYVQTENSKRFRKDSCGRKFCRANLLRFFSLWCSNCLLKAFGEGQLSPSFAQDGQDAHNSDCRYGQVQDAGSMFAGVVATLLPLQCTFLTNPREMKDLRIDSTLDASIHERYMEKYVSFERRGAPFASYSELDHRPKHADRAFGTWDGRKIGNVAAR